MKTNLLSLRLERINECISLFVRMRGVREKSAKNS